MRKKTALVCLILLLFATVAMADPPHGKYNDHPWGGDQVVATTADDHPWGGDDYLVVVVNTIWTVLLTVV